jgi:hypothetical protein
MHFRFAPKATIGYQNPIRRFVPEAILVPKRSSEPWPLVVVLAMV